jgi:hypothetical protein
MDNPMPSDLDAEKRARKLARLERNAQRRRERKAMAAGASPSSEQVVVRKPPDDAALPAARTPAGASWTSAAGPLGRRVARIATNMAIRQVIKFVMGALLRR